MVHWKICYSIYLYIYIYIHKQRERRERSEYIFVVPLVLSAVPWLVSVFGVSSLVCRMQGVSASWAHLSNAQFSFAVSFRCLRRAPVPIHLRMSTGVLAKCLARTMK